jgi:hypothetical protein
MELERKRREQQQQQHVSLLQQHLQMSPSSSPAVANGSLYQQQQGVVEGSAAAVNIPGVGARIKEIPTEVLKVSLAFLCCPLCRSGFELRPEQCCQAACVF